MALVHGSNDPIARALCELAGCPRHVQKIEYRSGLGMVTTVTIEYLPDVDGKPYANLGPLLKRFHLVEIGKADG